jgi:hypothetical protein
MVRKASKFERGGDSTPEKKERRNERKEAREKDKAIAKGEKSKERLVKIKEKEAKDREGEDADSILYGLEGRKAKRVDRLSTRIETAESFNEKEEETPDEAPEELSDKEKKEQKEKIEKELGEELKKTVRAKGFNGLASRLAMRVLDSPVDENASGWEKFQKNFQLFALRVMTAFGQTDWVRELGDSPAERTAYLNQLSKYGMEVTNPSDLDNPDAAIKIKWNRVEGTPDLYPGRMRTVLERSLGYNFENQLSQWGIQPFAPNQKWTLSALDEKMKDKSGKKAENFKNVIAIVRSRTKNDSTELFKYLEDPENAKAVNSALSSSASFEDFKAKEDAESAREEESRPKFEMPEILKTASYAAMKEAEAAYLKEQSPENVKARGEALMAYAMEAKPILDANPHLAVRDLMELSADVEFISAFENAEEYAAVNDTIGTLALSDEIRWRDRVAQDVLDPSGNSSTSMMQLIYLGANDAVDKDGVNVNIYDPQYAEAGRELVATKLEAAGEAEIAAKVRSIDIQKFLNKAKDVIPRSNGFEMTLNSESTVADLAEEVKEHGLRHDEPTVFGSEGAKAIAELSKLDENLPLASALDIKIGEAEGEARDALMKLKDIMAYNDAL